MLKSQKDQMKEILDNKDQENKELFKILTSQKENVTTSQTKVFATL